MLTLITVADTRAALDIRLIFRLNLDGPKHVVSV